MCSHPKKHLAMEIFPRSTFARTFCYLAWARLPIPELLKNTHCMLQAKCLFEIGSGPPYSEMLSNKTHETSLQFFRTCTRCHWTRQLLQCHLPCFQQRLFSSTHIVLHGLLPFDRLVLVWVNNICGDVLATMSFTLRSSLSRRDYH